MAESTNEQRLASELQTANDMIAELGNEIGQLVKDKAFLNSRVKQLNNIVNRLEKEKVELNKEKAERMLKEKPIPGSLPDPTE